MRMRHFYALLVVFVIGALIMVACNGAAQPPTATPETVEHMEAEEEHMEGEEVEEHAPEEHMEGAHDVPEEAAEVENPVEATDDSIAEGATLYANNCAVCHGETGEGDGPAGEALDPKPSDLHAEHVQELTDGGMFYIISHGRPETAMPAWEETLSVEERWHVVNFLRTFE